MKKKREPTAQARSLDWEAIHSALATVEAALEKTAETRPEALERAWAQRAAQLAQKPEETEPGEQWQLVVIRLGQEHYGLEVQHVFDVRPLGRLTPVPRVPAWVMGVVNLRGQILSVVDLAGFLGLAPADGSSGYLMMVQTPEMEVVLRVDEVLRVELLPLSRIHDSASAAHNLRPQYVRGLAALTPETTETVEAIKADQSSDGWMIILDLPALLRDPQLLVREESL